MAASVPRYLRQTKLGYLPLDCVIGSWSVSGGQGNSLNFDLIMLPVPEFQRMRSNVGLRHVVSPMPSLGSMPVPSYVIHDAKEVTVPEGEADPQGYARAYFRKAFNVASAD